MVEQFLLQQLIVESIRIEIVQRVVHELLELGVDCIVDELDMH